MNSYNDLYIQSEHVLRYGPIDRVFNQLTKLSVPKQKRHTVLSAYYFVDLIYHDIIDSIVFNDEVVTYSYIFKKCELMSIMYSPDTIEETKYNGGKLKFDTLITFIIYLDVYVQKYDRLVPQCLALEFYRTENTTHGRLRLKISDFTKMRFID